MSHGSYHAEVIGSLLRPERLVQARGELRAHRMPVEEYRRIEDLCVEDALQLQAVAGLDVVTDGEMRRDAFFDFFVSGMNGLEMLPGSKVRFHNHETEVAMEVVIPFSVTERISARVCPGVAEYQFTAAHTHRPVKVTLPSPGMITGFWNEHSRRAYPDPFKLMEDAAQAVQTWMQQLAAAGCRYIQIDAPELNEAYVDASVRADLERRGIPPQRFLDVGTQLVVELGEVKLPGVTKGLHVCKGNGTQSWIAEGGYDETARRLLSRAQGFDVFLMEFDDERSGAFEPLRHVPRDTMVILGLVSTKWTRMETPAELRSRITQAARFHPLERLGISTQCGFASATETAAGRRITEQVQREKLALVSEVARTVWHQGPR
jgi:5-methyltetrahydropteroyltriglutamate--homocysteine methyltransferase